jgi:hypothetical protein
MAQRDFVRSGYPGYTGVRPKLQIWHGTEYVNSIPKNHSSDYLMRSDRDQYLNDTNPLEAIKKRTNVLRYSTTPICVISKDPVSGWTPSIYGPRRLSSTPSARKASNTTFLPKPRMISIDLGLQFRQQKLEVEHVPWSSNSTKELDRIG